MIGILERAINIDNNILSSLNMFVTIARKISLLVRWWVLPIVRLTKVCFTVALQILALEIAQYTHMGFARPANIANDDLQEGHKQGSSEDNCEVLRGTQGGSHRQDLMEDKPFDNEPYYDQISSCPRGRVKALCSRMKSKHHQNRSLKAS